MVESGQPSILVSKVTSGKGASKKTSWVVHIPPTAAIIGGENVFDGITDVQLMGARANDLSDGIVKALKNAGAKKGQQMVMIGHSLGGIAAVATSQTKQFRKNFSAPSIITLGSPIASVPIPKDVRVLALEHRQDIFPALGGASNPKGSNVTTVTRDLAESADAKERAAAKDAKGTAAHSRKFYSQTLAMVDKNQDVSVMAFKKAVAGVLRPGAEVETTQYLTQRSK
jgi:alpha-beta hydrolase superfamily lysophospholipase